MKEFLFRWIKLQNQENKKINSILIFPKLPQKLSHVIKMLKSKQNRIVLCVRQHSQTTMVMVILLFVYAVDWMPSCELFHIIIPLCVGSIDGNKTQSYKTTLVSRELKKAQQRHTHRWTKKMIRKYGQITRNDEWTEERKKKNTNYRKTEMKMMGNLFAFMTTVSVSFPSYYFSSFLSM